MVLLNLSVWFPLQVCFLPEHAANPLQNLSLSEDLGWVWFIFSLLIFPHPLAGQWGLHFYGGHKRHDTRSSLDLCSTSRWEWCTLMNPAAVGLQLLIRPLISELTSTSGGSPSICHPESQWMAVSALHTIRYDTRCYINVRSKANMSQLNLPHGTDN